MTAPDRARHALERWRRATGADSLGRAERRTEMAEVAATEEAHLMRELDEDLRRLEDVVLAVAERRLSGRT